MKGLGGTLYVHPCLWEYGKNNLKRATLISREDFVAVVESLTEAIKGLKVFDDALQTDDEALKKAYQIVTEGVLRDGGSSWAEFDLDGRCAVSGGGVRDSAFTDYNDDIADRNHC